MRFLIGDILFGLAFWAIIAGACRIVLGPIEGLAVWRAAWFIACAGHIFGYKMGSRIIRPREEEVLRVPTL